MQLIDKAAVVAEMKKLQKRYSEAQTRNIYEEGLKEGRLIGYKDTLHKLDTIEMKEVDLDKEIKSFTEGLFHKVFDEDKSKDDFDWDDIATVIEYTAKYFFEVGFKSQNMEQKIITRPFNEVFSQEEIDAVDKKILEAQEKERKRLEKAWAKAKDFPMNN